MLPHLAVESRNSPEAADALARVLAQVTGVLEVCPSASIEGLPRGPTAVVGARLVGAPKIGDDEIALPLPLARRFGAPLGQEVRLLVTRLAPGGALGAEDVALYVLQIDDVPGKGAVIARIGLLVAHHPERASRLCSLPWPERAA